MVMGTDTDTYRILRSIRWGGPPGQACNVREEEGKVFKIRVGAMNMRGQCYGLDGALV